MGGLGFIACLSLGAIVVVIALAVIALYNRLVVLRNRVDNAWAQIDVQLKRRYDLIPNIVETVKTSSSKWIKTKGAAFADFHWQSGYGAFSVSQSDADAVIAYIRNQAQHHQKMTFQDEYRAIAGTVSRRIG